jgi:hypothetical protein
VRHEAADEMHVARQTIQLCYNDRTPEPAGISKSRGEFGAALQGVGAFPGFHLDIFGDDLEILSGGEPGERFPLRLEP